MKKVLASVLAGSMVLGMAAAASAATSLTLKRSDNNDYNYQLYLYTPDGTFVTDSDSAYALPRAVQTAFDEFRSEYHNFTSLSYDQMEAYFSRTTPNVFARYISFYNAADNEASPVNSGKDIKDDLGLVNPTSGFSFTALSGGAETTYTSISAFSAITPANAALALTNATYLSNAQHAFSDVTKNNSRATPASISARIEELAERGTTNFGGNGNYNAPNKSSVDITDFDHHMYTYGEDDAKEVEFSIIVEHGEDFRVDVASGNVSVSRKRIETNTVNNTDTYRVVIKATAGVRDFELADWKVELDCADANRVYFIEGDVAYSDYREVLPDDRYIIDESNTDDLHNDGCVFDFSEVIDEETRIICNDYVDVLFKGNYGTDFENLRVMTDDITEVEDFFQDFDIDYYDFIGTPKFAKDVTVRIDADSDAYIYEYDKNTGDVVDITDECEYTSDGMTFKRKALKTYVVLEEPYEGGNVKAEKEPVAEEEPEDEPDNTEEPKDDPSSEGSKPNPGTGAYPLF